MALIKSVDEIEKLIPAPNEKFFMGIMSHAPESVINQNPLFAIVVDEKKGNVIKAYKMVFVLCSIGQIYYLLINDINKEINSSTYFIRTKLNDGKKLSNNDWNFENDSIGLYIVVDNVSKHKIYFSTSILDVNEIRKKLEENKKELVIKTEVVYA